MGLEHLKRPQEQRGENKLNGDASSLHPAPLHQEQIQGRPWKESTAALQPVSELLPGRYYWWPCAQHTPWGSATKSIRGSTLHSLATEVGLTYTVSSDSMHAMGCITSVPLDTNSYSSGNVSITSLLS